MANASFHAAHGDRLLASLRSLGEDKGGFAVDRLEHSLQSATRAHRDGRDEEYVVCALMHDIGDLMGPSNHAEVGAIIMKPYVSEANHWMMDKHGIFQGYYFFHYIGLDREMREQYRGHPHFEYCAQFCHLYDQNSFDPAYDSMPLEAFEPMLRRVDRAAEDVDLQEGGLSLVPRRGSACSAADPAAGSVILPTP